MSVREAFQKKDTLHTDVSSSGTLVCICTSGKRGQKKRPVSTARLLRGAGIQGDAHAVGGLRQVSLLMKESVDGMRRKGLRVGYGDFAENMVTEGVDLGTAQVGDRIRVGETELTVTKIGKECESPCSIYYQVGYCIMPTEGVFCRVDRPGSIRVGDPIRIQASAGRTPLRHP